MTTETPPKHGWFRFDGSVTVTVVMLIVIQILTAMYAVGQFSQRVEALERGAVTYGPTGERMARIEAHLQAISERIKRIEGALDGRPKP